MDEVEAEALRMTADESSASFLDWSWPSRDFERVTFLRLRLPLRYLRPPQQLLSPLRLLRRLSGPQLRLPRPAGDYYCCCLGGRYCGDLRRKPSPLPGPELESCKKVLS